MLLAKQEQRKRSFSQIELMNFQVSPFENNKRCGAILFEKCLLAYFPVS